jgi:hypothetical protein
MNVNIYLYIVQTRLYSVTTTLHIASGPISLATPASLSSLAAQVQRLLMSSLPRLPDLLAATPAFRCCSVKAAHWEARPLVKRLAVFVRNGTGWVTSKEKWISGTLPTMQAAGATYRHGVGKGSYNLVTPALSICPLVCTCLYKVKHMYTCTNLYIHVWIMYIHVYISKYMYMYIPCTYIFIYIQNCMYMSIHFTKSMYMSEPCIWFVCTIA